MGLSLQIDLEEAQPLASNRGWSDLIAWAESLPAKKSKAIRHLCEYGWEDDLSGLEEEIVEALGDAPPHDHHVLTTVITLLGRLKSAEKGATVASVTDGWNNVPAVAAVKRLNMSEKIIRKVFELKAAAMEENRLRGAAAVMGVLDRGGDVIYPGAFKKCLKAFLADGFVPVGHDWSGLPIAMPTSAKEQGQNLLCEAEFHSTQEAKDARTVCMERMQKGLSVGLSVGFMPDYEEGIHSFSLGKDLLLHAEGLGCDMSLFDSKDIAACKDGCRGLSHIADLYEFSIVPVPMNPKATATDVKKLEIAEITTERQFEEFLREAGFARKAATVITLHGFAALRQREAEETEQETESEEEADVSEIQRRLLMRDRRLRELSLWCDADPGVRLPA